MEGLLLGLGWWWVCGAWRGWLDLFMPDTGKGSLKLCLT